MWFRTKFTFFRGKREGLSNRLEDQQIEKIPSVTLSNTYQRWTVRTHLLASLLRIVQVWRSEDLSNNELHKIN